MNQLFTEIRAKKKFLFDGAFGTELYNRGIFINKCFEEANINNCELVKQIYSDYLKAGANLITSNSWGANRFKLKNFSLSHRIEDINKKSITLLREIITDNAWAVASIGPLGLRIEPFGPTSKEEAYDAFSEQAQYLFEAGCDAISLETFENLAEIEQAIKAVRSISKNITLFAHMAINSSGETDIGIPAKWILKKLEQWDVDVIGFNCSIGPQAMMSNLEANIKDLKKPISVRPNAGYSKYVDGRCIYMCSPEYFAHFTKQFYKIGVQFVGGCCGTGPKHIRAMYNSKRYSEASQTPSRSFSFQVKQSSHPHKSEEKRPSKKIPFAKKSKLTKAINEGKKIFSVELLPPKTTDINSLLEKAQKIKEAGVNAINIPDGPRASTRMSAMLTSIMIEQKVNIETILHYTCRDRNLLGMQSDFLGLNSIGLKNVLLVTGDPPKIGNLPQSTGVFDVDSIGLTNMVSQLNQGLDLGGKAMEQATSITIGVAANPVHKDLDYELKRFEWKVKAGAEWTITQPIFDVDSFFQFKEELDKRNCSIPIIAGIWPLTSYKNALFMHNEVPGVKISKIYLKAMEETKNINDPWKKGVEIAQDMIEKLGTSVQGIQIAAPFGKVDIALKTLCLC